MQRIREAAGPDATVVQMSEYRTGKSVSKVSEPKLLAPGRPGEERPADPLTEAIMQADVIIGEPHPRLLYHQEDLPLKWLQMTWAGSDLYTRNARYTFPEGVMLTNVAGSAYGHTMSQYVVGQILAVTQNLAAYARQQPTKAWNDLGPVMSLEGATVLVFGAGEGGLERQLELLAESRQGWGRICFLKGYDAAVANQVYAAGDFFLIPSRYEPCGLTDYIAQLLGNLPIVHRVGGLVKVIDGETGFAYDDNSAGALADAMRRAMSVFAQGPEAMLAMQTAAVERIDRQHTWRHVMDAYLALYREAMERFASQ